MAPKIDQEIIDEVWAMADILDNSEDDGPECAATFRFCAECLESGKDIPPFEHKALAEELADWMSKDYWMQRGPKRKLVVAMARLGMLEEFNPQSVYINGYKPRIVRVDGKEYVA